MVSLQMERNLGNPKKSHVHTEGVGKLFSTLFYNEEVECCELLLQ